MSTQLTTTTQLIKFTIKEFAGFQIKQREDGYLNATEMCKVGGKEWSGYMRNAQTKEYLEALENALQIYRAELIQSITANCPDRGTWIHPRVAIHLAQWVSPQFAVQVTDWVLRFMSGDLTIAAEVVDRHDAINNTQSSIMIESVSRQLVLSKQHHEESIKQVAEYKFQVVEFKSITNKLEQQVKNLTIETVRLNNLKCPYCAKMYSSPIGLTRHIRHNCDDNMRRRFRAIINEDKFKIWAKFVVNDWVEICDEYKFDFNLVLKSWDTATPSIKMIVADKKKNTVFNILRNEDRWQFLALINQIISVPLKLLMEANSLKMYNENKETFNIYIDAIEHNAELLKHQELYNLIPEESEETEETEES